MTGDVPPVPCPSGSWCPSNIYIPLSCEAGAYCSSSRSFYLLGIFLSFGVVLVILFVHSWRKGYLKWLSDALLRSTKGKQSILSSAHHEKIEIEPLIPSRGEEEEDSTFRLQSVRAGVEIALENVSVKRGKLSGISPLLDCGAQTVLSDISGRFGAGQLIAIMVRI